MLQHLVYKQYNTLFTLILFVGPQAKTRELDTCQQQVRDMQAAMTSLENSKGWFERALKDAEEVAAKKEEEHQTVIEQTKLECKKEIEVFKKQIKRYIASPLILFRLKRFESPDRKFVVSVLYKVCFLGFSSAQWDALRQYL